MGQILNRLHAEFAAAATSAAVDDTSAGEPFVATIAAPVFGARGAVELILCLHPTRPLAEEAVGVIGDAVRSAAAGLSVSG
ncbi:hypothetical protein [[Mycobacterium] holstebronense]|uniref:IclR-ED domain-containing protein n=1 Tax=[Mycobacterium] holstebronense TaxID=3064288 RepID=A0ABN9NLQ3_9MYCO|nr:hypothetical protein [Mycolicibacter sp. MU0102]CAJ1508633.1 hypothetical protein MU0102_003471 [Mycolicibacter sp. MU0102]